MSAAITVDSFKISRTQYLQYINWDSDSDSDNPLSITINAVLGGADAGIIKVITIPDPVEAPTAGYDAELFDALGNSVFDLVGLATATTETHRIETGAARLVTIGGSGYRLELSDYGGASKQGKVVLWLSY